MTIELSACGLLRIYSGGINIKMRGRYFALQIRMIELVGLYKLAPTRFDKESYSVS